MASVSNMKVFQEINQLILAGNGIVIISEDGTIVGIDKATQLDSYLILESNKANINNCVSVIGINGDLTVSASGSSNVNTCLFDNSSGFLFDNEKSKITYKLGKTCVINSISTADSSELLQLPAKFISSGTFSIVIAGSRDVNLPKDMHFTDLTIKILDRGNVNCNGAISDKIIIIKEDSGKIKELFATGSSMISVTENEIERMISKDEFNQSEGN